MRINCNWQNDWLILQKCISSPHDEHRSSGPRPTNLFGPVILNFYSTDCISFLYSSTMQTTLSTMKQWPYIASLEGENLVVFYYKCISMQLTSGLTRGVTFVWRGLIRPKKNKKMCVYGHLTDHIFQPPTLTFFISNYSTLIFASDPINFYTGFG